MKRKTLESIEGVTNVEGYCLVSNDGYTFEKAGNRYDLRHWLNCYGCSVDYWTVSGNGFNKSADTFDEAVEIIKSL